MTPLGKMKGVAGDLASKAGDLKDIGVEKIKATVEELNTTLPYVREVGYSVTRVGIELALAPKIVVSLYKVFDVEAERFDAVLKELAQYKVFCTVLGALRQVNNLQAKIQFQGRCLKEVEIELGLPPSVKMVFLEVQPSGPRPPLTSSGQEVIVKEIAAPVWPPEAAPPETTETKAAAETEVPPAPAKDKPAFEVPPALPEDELAPEAPPAPPPDIEPARTGTVAMAVSPAAQESAPVPEPELPEVLAESELAPLPEVIPLAPQLEVPGSPPLPILETPPESRAKAAPASPVPGKSMIHFRCFGCNHRVRAPEKAVGRLARCKKCGTLLKVPAASK
jgi:hypothetical protein